MKLQAADLDLLMRAVLNEETQAVALRLFDQLEHPYHQFQPRPDSEGDEQTSFVNEQFPGIACVVGANGCLAGETLIYDPIQKQHLQVDQIKSDFHVYAKTKNGQKVIARGLRPFKKRIAGLYRYHLSNGQNFVSTQFHRVFASDGCHQAFYAVHACVGLSLVSSGTELLEVHLPSEQHCFHKVPNWKDHYWLDYHPYDGRPLQELNSVQAFSPSRGDVHEHTLADWHEDGHYFLPKYNLLVSQQSAHQSKSNFVPSGHRSSASHNHADAELWRWSDFCNRASRQSLCMSSQIDNDESFLQPANRIPCSYITKIEFVRTDWFYDFTVPFYHNYELAGIWHHNSGKDYCSGWKVTNFLFKTEPPEQTTPYWVLSKTMDQVGQDCWQQSLRHWIPENVIDEIRWYNKAMGYPKAVILKPSKNGHRWALQFKSYDQGREALQGANIAGFYCSEQCPLPLLREVIARTRKWAYPSSQIYNLTPLSPDVGGGGLCVSSC